MSNDQLNKRQVMRYSRHLLMKEIGVAGQQALIGGRVLLVGMGGLGCPCAMYLAAAGVGTLGLLDYDVVEESNLHRQVLHKESGVGLSKVESASQFIADLNSDCHTIQFNCQLSRENAVEIVKQFDVVVDCLDNAPTRYLLNDACVLSGKPLVSASALRTEGQLTVYNYNDSPCYRCLFPEPPFAGAVVNCADGGVIGSLVGTLGSMQATEVVKILIQRHRALNNTCNGYSASKQLQQQQATKNCDIMAGKMLLYNAFMNSFKVIQLRKKKPDCSVCGDHPTITADNLPDYEQFCGQKSCDKSKSLKLLSEQDRITVQEYEAIQRNGTAHRLIDVRDELQFQIVSLPGAINIPLSYLNDDQILSDHNIQRDELIYVICRRGNASQKGVLQLKKLGYTNVKDIVGGITQYANCLDDNMPTY
ncbi:hypothetical protein MP228_005395 [Amoeboaphelidium protococcarum]|nr:hypothetical protein MP228_005395 [Amoeboaphelidium protococcarum]